MSDLEPIPSGVCYDREWDNFYYAGTSDGLGVEFWEKWKFRAAEFPKWVPLGYNLSAAYLTLHRAACKVRDALALHQNTRLSKTLSEELNAALGGCPQNGTKPAVTCTTPGYDDTMAYFEWKGTTRFADERTPEVKLGWDAGCAHVRKELELQYEGERDRLLAEVDRISGVLTSLHSTACKVRDALQLHQNTRLSATLVGELNTALAKVSP